MATEKEILEKIYQVLLVLLKDDEKAAEIDNTEFLKIKTKITKEK